MCIVAQQYDCFIGIDVADNFSFVAGVVATVLHIFAQHFIRPQLPPKSIL